MSLDPLQIKRWMDGECSETERIEIEALLAAQPHALNELLNESWNKADTLMPAAAATRLQAALQTKIQPRTRVLPLLRRVAVAAVLTGVLLAVRWYKHPVTVPSVEPAVVWKTLVNTHPNKIKITLPDGSKVWLHEKATLQYAADFHTRRQVQLSGEAFFDVTANTHPFTLVSGEMQTTVLGTRFNVEAHPGEQMTRVSLLTGKVAVTIGKRYVVLQPGRALISDIHGIREESVNTNFGKAWMGTDLVFNHLPLSDVLRRTGDHYGLQIVYDTPLPPGRYFNSVLPGNDLQAVLSNLSFVYKLQFHQQGDTLRVTP